MRRGFTLHELMISLAVAAGVFALVTQFALGQMRFQREATREAEGMAQLGQAADILAGALAGVSPGEGDLLAAEDTAIEFRMQVGTGVTCDSGTRRVVIPVPNASPGNAWSAFTRTPHPGDDVTALAVDSSGLRWIPGRVAEPPTVGSCRWSGGGSAWVVSLRDSQPSASLTVVRFSRPIRFSLYRASNGRWYLGAKDWNGAMERLNGIQPVAGPLRPWSSDPTRTGLWLEYRNRLGVSLPAPVMTREVASVVITLRGETSAGAGGPATQDSHVVVVALRNAP